LIFALQAFYISYQRSDCGLPQSLKRGHSGSRNTAGDNAKQLTRRKLLRLRISNDVGRTLAAHAVKAMASGASRREELRGALALRRVRRRVLRASLRRREARNKQDEQAYGPQSRLAHNPPKPHFMSSA
jgi:hypothetical protein